MRKTLLCILLIASVRCGFANSDSLWTAWENQTLESRERMTALDEFTKRIIFSRPDSALTLFEIQLRFVRANDLDKEAGRVYNRIAVCYDIMAKPDSAQNYYEYSLKEHEDRNDLEGLASVCNNLGNLCSKRGQLLEAMSYYNRSLKIAESLKDDKSVASYLSNLGNLYKHVKDYEKAEYYYRRSLDIQLERGDRLSAANNYNNLSTIYFDNGSLDTAMEYLRIAHQIVDSAGRGLAIALFLNNIGSNFQVQGNNDSAKVYFRRSMDVYRSLNRFNDAVSPILSMGRMYMREGEYDSVALYAPRGYEMAERSGNIHRISQAALLLYEFSKATGDTEKALEMLEVHNSSRDSINKIENQRGLIRQELQYKFEKDIMVREERERKRIIFITTLALLPLLIIVVYWRRRQLIQDAERERLIIQIDLLKERALSKSLTGSDKPKDVKLNKSRIERSIDSKLNETDWSILNIVYAHPMITNREISEQIALSVEGTSSSLRKMYRLFNINAKRNHKMALVMEAARISVEENGV